MNSDGPSQEQRGEPARRDRNERPLTDEGGTLVNILICETTCPPDALPDRLLLLGKELPAVVRPLVRIAIQPQVERLTPDHRSAHRKHPVQMQRTMRVAIPA